MELSPPVINWQTPLGPAGAQLGVVIGFNSPDWQTPDLTFTYSIDNGRSWRPLVRDSAVAQRGWSAVVYGVKSRETVLVRAALEGETGPPVAFTVAEGVDAATSELRKFIPNDSQSWSQPPLQRRLIRRNQNLGRTVYFTTGFGEVYHASPDCSGLRSGQSGVAWRGGTPADVVAETVSDAIFEGKRPCRVCRPPSD